MESGLAMMAGLNYAFKVFMLLGTGGGKSKPSITIYPCRYKPKLGSAVMLQDRLQSPMYASQI